MFCTHCGTKNEDGAAFCSNCGKPLNGETPVQPQQPVQPVQPQQPAQTIIIQQIVQHPAEPAEPAPTGLKKIMYLVGAICSFVAIVLLFGLFFGSGISSRAFGMEMTRFTTVSFFDANGIWLRIINGLESNVRGVISLLLSAILIFAGIITLLVYFIIGIVKFVKAMKGTDYHGINRIAIKTFGVFAMIELLVLLFNAETGVGLNSAALAGFCLGAILIGANIVMHFVGNLKENLGLKKLLRLGANLLVLAVAIIIAALAAGPVLNLNGGGFNFFAVFMDSVVYGPMQRVMYAVLGWVSCFVLVSLGVSLIQLMFLKTLDHVNGKENQKSGLGYTIASFIFGLILVVVTYLYGKEVHATVNGALPIVIMVFSFLASAGIIVRNKLLGK